MTERNLGQIAIDTMARYGIYYNPKQVVGGELTIETLKRMMVDAEADAMEQQYNHDQEKRN